MRPAPGPWVRSVGTALPPNWVDQETLISIFREHWAREHFNVERIEELHRSVQVGGRYLALPLEKYLPLERFSERNEAFNQVSLDLGEQAVRRALDLAGIQPRDVDHLFFVTVTGIATASRILLTHEETNPGSAIKHAPKAPRCTRSLGQPMLRLISS